MAKIFVGYKVDANEYVDVIQSGLEGLGHTVIPDRDIFGGEADSWKERLGPTLRSCDVFIPLITSGRDGWSTLDQEIGIAVAYAETSGRMLIIPVLLTPTDIPSLLSDRFVIDATDRDFGELFRKVNEAIAAFEGRLLANQQRAAEVAERVEQNLSEYLEDAVKSQKLLESRNWIFGLLWYVLGFICLILGAMYAAFGLNGREYDEPLQLIGIVSSSIAIVGFLGAGARYAFILAKSHINESLKNSDRLHAISFGRFYLRAYGENATWSELKEVFSNWNISRPSSFEALSASDVDPKVIDALVDACRSVSNQKK